MLVEQYPGFIVPVNMFALDLRGLGGVIRRQNTTETEAEPWVFHRVLYNLQQVDTANNLSNFLKDIFCILCPLHLQDILIMFALNPMLEPGDTVTLEMEYDANVNYNVLGGYGEMR